MSRRWSLVTALPGAGGRLAVAVLAIVIVYAPALVPMAREWATFPNLSHGFAIPLIAGYLAWSQRQYLARLTPRPSWGGLPVVVGGLALYVVGTLGLEPFVARASFPVTLLGAAVLLGGTAVARRLLPAVGYLFFMIPLPWMVLRDLTDKVRLFDAAVTAAVVPWLGVPVLREGAILHLPEIRLEVADVCSSIPSIAALLALGAAYGVGRGRSGRACLLLLMAAFPLGAISNLTRIISTVAGVYYLGPVVLESVLHTWNGTVVFLMTFGALVLLDAGLCRVRRGH